MTYLGLSLGDPIQLISIWDDGLGKMELRMASWKMMYLFRGGMVTLIKHTLSNLSNYFLSLFPLLTKVAHHMEKLQRDFLWEINDEFKSHPVKQATICSLIL